MKKVDFNAFPELLPFTDDLKNLSKNLVQKIEDVLFKRQTAKTSKEIREYKKALKDVNNTLGKNIQNIINKRILPINNQENPIKGRLDIILFDIAKKHGLEKFYQKMNSHRVLLNFLNKGLIRDYIVKYVYRSDIKAIDFKNLLWRTTLYYNPVHGEFSTFVKKTFDMSLIEELERNKVISVPCNFKLVCENLKKEITNSNPTISRDELKENVVNRLALENNIPIDRAKYYFERAEYIMCSLSELDIHGNTLADKLSKDTPKTFYEQLNEDYWKIEIMPLIKKSIFSTRAFHNNKKAVDIVERICQGEKMEVLAKDFNCTNQNISLIWRKSLRRFRNNNELIEKLKDFVS